MRLLMRTVFTLLAGLAPATVSAQVTLHGVGDLPGGPNISIIRDATKQGGVIYAVGASAANTQVLCTGPNTPAGCVPQFNADTAVLWTWNGTSGTLTRLPNLVANNTASSGLFSASAITPDAAFIASQARSASGVGFLAVRVATNGLVNMNLNAAPFPNLNPNTAALAISSDGSVLYGLQNTDGTTHAVRFDVNGSTSSIIPLLAGTTNNQPALKGTSSNGTTMVGTAFTQPYSGTTNGRAFRYTHGSGVNGIPMLTDGTWNKVLAVSADGDLTLVAGDSHKFANGEIYLRRLSTLTTTPLGSPNQAMNPGNQGSMTADGSVVLVTFANPVVPQATIPDRYTYFHNSHGWFQLVGALRKAGVEPGAEGWGGLTATGMSSDGTLVYGYGFRSDDSQEGFVAEFPAGFLANYDAPATTPSNPTAVGAWAADGTNDSAVLTLMANGVFYFIVGDAGDTGPLNPGGFERGTYTWDAQGHVVFTFHQDTNGSAGFSDIDGAVLSGVVVGDTLTFTAPPVFCDPGEDCSISFARIAGGAASIVGGFAGGDPATDDDSFVVILKEDGTFFFASDTTGVDGIEKGTYTWDPVTHDFHVTSKVLDTNVPDDGVTDSNVVLSPNGLLATVTGPEGVTVVARIGSVAPPSLRLNGVAAPAGITVSGGATISVELTNGPGQVGDWLALVPAGAPDAAYVAWKYLGNTQTRPTSGLTTATVTFTAPAGAGGYQVRLFRNDTWTLLATSAAITIAGPTLSLNGVAPPTGVTAAGGALITVDLINGPGQVGDWLALVPAGAPDAAYVAWKYLGNTQTRPTSGLTTATVTFTAPAAAGGYQVRLFRNDSWTLLATSATITIAGPRLSLNGVAPPTGVTVAGGALITVDLINGPGQVGDWLALVPAGAPDTAYVTWKYLGNTQTRPASGLTTATVTFTAPGAAGSYNVRLFRNDTWGLLATSALITVQ